MLRELARLTRRHLPMTDRITQQQINQTAWTACDTFRGAVDAGQYKDYILMMLFLKTISDR